MVRKAPANPIKLGDGCGEQMNGGVVGRPRWARVVLTAWSETV